MKKKIYIIIIALIAFVCDMVAAKPATELELSVGADLVSAYVWRGAFQTNVAIQPHLAFTVGNDKCGRLGIGTWGSTDFTSAAKEIDLYLSYQIKGFSIGVTDYWWSGQGMEYFNWMREHYLEANLSYYVSDKVPLTISWNTMFGIDKDKDEDGKQMYSTYVSLAYDIAIKRFTLTPSVAITPWKGIYADGFNVMAVALRGSTSFNVAEKLEIPIFVDLIGSPANNDFFIVAGAAVQFSDIWETGKKKKK